MKRHMLISRLGITLLLAACSGQTTNPDGAIPGTRPDALGLTTLGNEAGVATLTFINVQGVDVPALRKVVSVQGVSGDRLRSIDYAPDGTLYGLGVLSVSEASTGAALYTIDPVTGEATQTSTFTLPFEPDDIRFIPGTSVLRVTGGGTQFELEKTTTVDVAAGEVGAASELTRAVTGGQNAVATAIDYADGVLHAVVGTAITGYQNYFATADAEPPTGFTVSDVMLQPGSSFIGAYVQDGNVGYGALMTYEQPEADPRLVAVSLTGGTFTDLGTFPVSQIALARTPASVVEALFE